MKWIIYKQKIINLQYITEWKYGKSEKFQDAFPFFIIFEIDGRKAIQVNFSSKGVQELCFNEIIKFIEDKNATFFIIPDYSKTED